MSIVKDLKRLREADDKKREKEKLSIVCEHILIGSSPQKQTMAIISQVTNPHPKHDGQVFLCFTCDKLFEREDGLDILSGMIYLAPEKKFKYNLSNTSKGLKL